MPEQTTPVVYTPPTIQALPQPVPQRGSSQPNFTARANEFMAAVPTLLNDLSASLQWIKDAIDSLEGREEETLLALQTEIDNIATARQEAIDALNLIKGEIETIAVDLGDPQGDLETLRDDILSQVQKAGQDALDALDSKCSTLGGEGSSV